MKEVYNPFAQISAELSSINDKLDALDKKIILPPVSPPDSEMLLTTDQVCQRLNISRVTAWKWEKKNILRPVRVGNLKRFKLKDIKSISKNDDTQ